MPEVAEKTQQQPTMEEYVASRKATAGQQSAAAALPEKAETAPESAAGTPESESDKKSKGGGFQRRIDKLTKRGTELEESLREEREARQRLEAKLAGRDPAELTKKQQSTELGARPKPKTDDKNPDGTAKYADFEAYEDDLLAWNREKIKAELTADSKKAAEGEQIRQQDQKIIENFTKKKDAAMEKYADFEEVVLDEDAPEIKPGSVIDGFILDPENEGLEVLYYLRKNPDEVGRISAMSPQKQIRELGKIEEKILEDSKSDSSPEPKKAALPAPIKPISTSTSKSAVSPDKMSMEEYAKWRRAPR